MPHLSFNIILKLCSISNRKQLPPALDMPDVKVERLLPQDYFENDLEVRFIIFRSSLVFTVVIVIVVF